MSPRMSHSYYHGNEYTESPKKIKPPRCFAGVKDYLGLILQYTFFFLQPSHDLAVFDICLCPSKYWKILSSVLGRLNNTTTNLSLVLNSKSFKFRWCILALSSIAQRICGTNVSLERVSRIESFPIYSFLTTFTQTSCLC